MPEYEMMFQAERSIALREPIRADLAEIVGRDHISFYQWYFKRRNAVDELLRLYEQVGSIPHLGHAGNDQATFGNREIALEAHIAALKKAGEHLEKIKEYREATKTRQQSSQE